MNSNKIELLVQNFTSSGLGDRFVDVFLLSVLRNCWKDKVERISINWSKFDPYTCHPSVPDYRFKDVLKKNIIEHIVIPNGIVLLDESDFPYQSELDVHLDSATLLLL